MNLNASKLRENAFDLIRIFAAGAVLLSHSFPLTGLVEPAVGHKSTLGSLAVWIFFALSGYLVAASLTHTPTVAEFLRKRVLRVFPALIFFIFFSVLIIGPLLSNLHLASYFSNPKTWLYFLHNPAFGLQSELPGVFEKNVFPLEFNGSMWTIKYELLMYAILATLSRKNISRNVIILFSMFLFGNLIHSIGLLDINKIFWRIESWSSFTAERLCLLGSIFFSGVLVHLFFDRLTSHRVAIVAALMFLATSGSIVFRSMVAITLPIIVIYIAYNCPAVIRKLAPRSDLSYGVYLWAFTVQQFFASVGLVGESYWAINLVLSVLVTGCIAWLSWHFLEKPALRFKKSIVPMTELDTKSFAERTR